MSGTRGFRTFLLLAAGASLLAGCSASSTTLGGGISIALPVDTIAGAAGVLGSSDGSGVDVSFSSPTGIAGAGSALFIVDTGNGSIRQLDLNSGTVSTLATGLNSPHGITSDGTNLYVADTYNHIIRKVVIATGAVSTFAGVLGTSGSTNGGPGVALFNCPYGITTDGTNLFVTDTYNQTIRQIVLTTQATTTVAGTPGSPGSADGTGAAGLFSMPYGVVVTGGSLYIADSSNFTIRKVVIATSAVTTIAGQVGVPGTKDATGTSASFDEPGGLATDGTSLFITDTYNHTIRQMDLGTTSVTTRAGQPGKPGSTDGDTYSASGVYKYTPALFDAPQGICAFSGHLYIADTGNSVVREIP